jgi:hypothetical protein
VDHPRGGQVNGLEEILEDVLKQYQRVGYQTQVLRLKNTGEVLVSLRMGASYSQYENLNERSN